MAWKRKYLIFLIEAFLKQTREKCAFLWGRQSRDVPYGGPHVEAGPQGDETEDVQGCDLLHTELPHLCGPAASRSSYLKEFRQHIKMEPHM